MFFIILIIGVWILLVGIAIKREENVFLSLGASILFSVIIVLLGFIVTDNYEDNSQYICDTELIQLNTFEDNPIYVIKTDRWEYSYKPIGSKEDDKKILRETDGIYLDIVQLDNCKNPVLKQYSRKTKWGFFSIGGIQRKEYVFYIPTGTYQGLYDLE